MPSLALRRLYDPRYMVRESFKLGEIPPFREAYGSAFTVAGPAISETFLIALITMVDTIMVSSLGETAIAAVGLVTQPRFIVMTLVLSLNMAVTSITARRKGEGNSEGACDCLKQSLILSVALSVSVAAVAFRLDRQILLFAGAQDDTIGLAREYFDILLFGIPANCISLTISAAQRGIGQTRVSMMINMLANAVNLVFNYLLIGGNFGFPAWGVKGAAVATVIGWVCGLVLAVLSVVRRGSFLYILSRGGWRFQKPMLKSIFQVGSGSFVEQVCMRVGFLTYHKIIAGLGTVIYATHIIAINILSLSFSFGEGFGIAASSLVGQSLGAKRPDIATVYGKICQRMSLIASTVLFFVFAFGGRLLVSFFSRERQVLEIGAQLMIIAGFIIFGQSSQMIFMGSLRGAGDTRYVGYISLVSVLLVRPLLAYFLAYTMGLGVVGAWAAFFADQYLRLLLTYVRFSSGKWMQIKL